MDAPPPFACLVKAVHDGDTFTCANGQIVRIARIDAPDFRTAPKCRRNPKRRDCNNAAAVRARDALASLIRGRALRCQPVVADPRHPSAGFTSYGRIVARCTIDDRVIGDVMISTGYARRWPGRKK